MAMPRDLRTTSTTLRALVASHARVLTAAVAVTLMSAGMLILTGGPGPKPVPGPDLARQQAQAVVVEGIEQHLDDAGATSSTRPSARPPALRQLAPGVWSLVTIPRLNLRVPVRAGTDAEVLSEGLGQWQNGVAPGQRGNFVLAGHRVTETEPFAAFPTLRKGDRVLVRTSNALYTYVLDTSGTDVRVDQHALWVTGAHPAGSRTDHVITLITCAETFHTDERSVVFGHLVGVRLTT
jgi:sortase A